jgi:hypothetical protein
MFKKNPVMSKGEEIHQRPSKKAVQKIQKMIKPLKRRRYLTRDTQS